MKRRRAVKRLYEQWRKEWREKRLKLWALFAQQLIDVAEAAEKWLAAADANKHQARKALDK